MTKEKYIEFCKTILGTSIDNPFPNDYETYVVRHIVNKKWFALIMELNGKAVVNLKCEPMQADFLREIYTGVIPAYHMNKIHWNTVYLDSDVPNEEIVRMTMDSFGLTDKKKKHTKKEEKDDTNIN